MCVYVLNVFVTLTPQNTLLGKAGGSTKLQKWSQTQLVHLLVSSPINKSLFPARHTDAQRTKYTSRNMSRNEILFYCSVVHPRDSLDLLWRRRRSEPALHPTAHPAALWRRCSQWNWGWRGREGRHPEPRTWTSEGGRFCCKSHQPCVQTEQIRF